MPLGDLNALLREPDRRVLPWVCYLLSRFSATFADVGNEILVPSLFVGLSDLGFDTQMEDRSWAIQSFLACMTRINNPEWASQLGVPEIPVQ